MMKRLMCMGRRVAMTAALAGLLLPAACVQEDGGQTGRATVTLTVMTRAVSTSEAEDGMLEDNEQMKTLRVIVARQNGEIVDNQYIANIQDDVTEQAIHVEVLSVNAAGEDLDFYAIANERSFLATDESLDNITIAQFSDLKQRIIDNDFNTANSGNLPPTGYKTIHVGPGSTTDNIQLEFVVAKVYVQFVNETGTAQTINNLWMEDVAPNQGYLFDDTDDTMIYIPANTTYGNLTVEETITIPAGTGEGSNTAAYKVYLYPGSAQGKYTLQALWNGVAQSVDCNTQVGAGLDRGQQLSIIVTLLGGEKEFTVNCLVNAWDEKGDMDITFN